MAGLGKDTADKVTKVATLKANINDIKWQVCWRRRCSWRLLPWGGEL